MSCTYIIDGKAYNEENLLKKFNSPVERQQQAIQWLKQNTNATDADFLPVVDGLLTNGALGRMMEDGKFLFSNLAPESVIYHEAFHRIYNFFATDEERLKLIEDFKKSKVYKNRIAELNSIYNSPKRIEIRGKVLTEEDLIEEALAEEFQEFKLGGQVQNKLKETLFTKILNFIKDLLTLTKKLDNVSYRRQFYQRIVDGQFSHSSKLISKIEQYKDSVFENIKGLSTENVIDVTNSIHDRFIGNALKKGKLYDIVDGNNTDYDELFNDAFWDTVEELDVINPKIGDNVALSVNQLKDRHKLILKDFNILTEDVENLEDKLFSDEKSKDTEFNKNSVEFDPRASMKKAAKLVLSTLTHSQVNSVGLPTNVSYREVNNILLRNLSNVPTDIEEYLYTINKLSNKFPYLTKLHSLLSENSSNTRLVGDFIDSFNNTFVNYNLITDVGGNLKTMSSADASIKNNVIADWKLNLENNINTNPNIVEELSNFKINRKTLYKFYNLLGIADVKFTDQALTEAGLIQSIIKSKKDLKPKDLLTIFDVKDTTFKTEKGYNLSYIFSDLALEEYKNRDDIDVMIFNIEGKPVYPVTQYNYLSMTIGWMNYYKQKFYDNPDIKEQFKERGLRAYLETKIPHLFNVQTINSEYLFEFINSPNQRLSYSLFLGVKIGKNELDFKTATEADYYVTALKMFLQNKEIFSLTQGDRQIFPTFKIPRLFNNIETMTSAYIGYIKDEVEKFKLLEKNPSIISKMDIDFSKTIIDPEIFNIKDAFSNYDNLDEYLDSKRNEIYKSLTNFVNKNKAYYIKVLKDELELKINKLFNKSDLGTASFEDLVENWFINQYMGNIEQFKLFYGDISLFGDYSNLWKRLNTPTSTGSPGNVSEYLLDELNNEDDKYTIGDFNYRISRENAGVHKTTIKEQFLKDKDTESEVVSNIEAIAKAKYEKLFKVFDWKEIYKKEQKKIDKFEGNTPLEKLINYKVAKDTAPYRKITEGDGFSYLNLYEWKRIMKIWKLWTDKHDRLFEREYEVLKITMNKELSNEQKMEEINNLFASNSIDVDDYFDQHEQASLLKPQYSGVIYDKPFTEYVQLSFKERMNIYGIRKTSFMPLLPSVIFGTGLEKMHEKMLLSGTGVVFYESAAKVGAVKKDKMYNSDDVVSMENNQFIDDASTYLNYQYLKNQLYIKSEEKKSIIDSTQSRKNMIADKYHQKVPIDFILKNADEGKTFKDIKTDWNSLSEKDKLVNSELHSYVEEYLKTLNVIIDRNTKLLLAELDIKNLDESFEDFDIKNIKKLLKLLKKQARSRNNTLDIIDAFQYMIDRGSTLFNVFPNQSKLESILTSMVTSNVIKFKRIGSDYAQVSPVMWETKDSERINNNKTNPKVLKFYSEDLKPSEVMIPAPKDLLKKLEQAIKNPKDNKEIFKYYQAIKGDYPDGFNIKLLTDLLNKLIEVGYLDTEVTFKALRIPNQELSSNDVIKVKKFLLPTMSKMVVINAEMVAKTGSDFDIDKLNVYFKYLDKSLKTIKYTEGTDEESISQRFKSHSQERIQSMIENLLDKDISSISKEISNIYEDIATLKKEFSDELEDYQDLKEESGELYQQYKSEMATVLDSFKQDIITYNQSNSQFDFKLSEQEIQELENVNTIGKLKHFLFKIKTNKENELGNSLIILRSIKNDLNEKLNNLYKTLPKNKDPFLNKEFSNLHSEYTKAKYKLEQYLDENDNSYKTVLATILQLDTIFDSVNNLKEALNVKNKTKNELNEKINEEFFEKIKQLKFQKEIWQNMELELFKKLPIEVQNSSSALYNKLSEIEENLILNEWNLSDLLHPIGDGGLKEFLEEEIEPTQNESDRFSIKEKKALYHSLHPSNNLSKKLDLKEAEIGIGQFATHLTHHSIGRDIVLYPTMFSKKHKQTLSTELKFDGFQNDYSLDNYLTSDIENIFQLISGHLTTQVDAAKEPYAVYLNIKNNTIPIISYLIRRGVSKDIVYRFMTQPKVLEYISKSGNYRSLSYKFSNNKLYSTFFSPSKVAFKKIFNLKEKEKLSFDFENINSISLKDLKTKQDDISFQKNAVLYFISLEEQAKTFNNLRKLMSSDTTFHKSLSSYKELMNLQKEVEETRMFGNDIKPYLEQGFIKPFTKSAKLYYHPWKSLFLSSREFASYIGNYIDIYSNAIADSLGLSKQDSEKRTKIRNSMERQFFAFIKDSYVKPQTNIDVASALSYIGKNYKAINVKKLFSVLMNYGLENKKNVVQSKLKSFTPFEINNYILLFRKLATVKAINISNNETVTGEELVKAIYYQHLKQTKNDFSPFAIDTLIPGNIKMEVLSQILDEFLKKESSNFNEIFTKFVKEFQLANDRYIGYGTFKGLLGKSTENFGEETSYTTIKDEFENSYESKSFAYDSNLESEDVENVTPSEDNYDEDSKSINDYITQPLSELQKLKDFHKTPIITKNSIKNIYFFDGASKDTVNGSNAYLNDSILDFEKGVVYIKTPSIVLDGEKRDSKKLKIGTYEIENGSKQVTINFNNVYASLKRNTKQQESMPQQSEVNTVEQKLDISNSTKKSLYFEKDRLKFSKVNKLISRGSVNSSSEAYRIAVGNKANTGNYVSTDIVGISSEGSRAGRIKSDFNEIQKAINAGVTFITDVKSDRNRDYNIGEREVAEYLSKNGYVETQDGIWNKQQSNTVEQNVKGIEINSYQIGLGNDLTNVHYTNSQYPKSKYPIVPTNKDLKLTQAAKTKWGESVEAWYKSNNAQTKGIPEGEQGDKYDFDLMVGLITDKLTQYPNLVEQINQNGGLAFLQASTHTMGTGRWSSKNSKNMFINSLIQAYKNVVKQSETKDVIQIPYFRTNRVKEGKEVLPTSVGYFAEAQFGKGYYISLDKPYLDSSFYNKENKEEAIFKQGILNINSDEVIDLSNLIIPQNSKKEQDVKEIFESKSNEPLEQRFLDRGYKAVIRVVDGRALEMIIYDLNLANQLIKEQQEFKGNTSDFYKGGKYFNPNYNNSTIPKDSEKLFEQFKKDYGEEAANEAFLQFKSFKDNLKSIHKDIFSIETKDVNQSKFEQADKLTPIEQNFKDGQGGRTMQSQFKGKSTMDLIISGDRTRTTRANTDIQRMTKDYGLSKISDLVGKVIRMTDKLGNQVYTEITGVFPFTQEYQDKTWQKEGWTKDVTDKLVGQYPYAIEFKVVNKETKDTQITKKETKTACEGGLNI